jgi:mannose-6-phosphate isomerase-like protein (cupin superfamily)
MGAKSETPKPRRTFPAHSTGSPTTTDQTPDTDQPDDSTASLADEFEAGSLEGGEIPAADVTLTTLDREDAAADFEVGEGEDVRPSRTAPPQIDDIGPRPQSFDLERATVDNPNYRTVVWSGRYLQVTLMSIPVGSDIGLELHAETDQFLRLDAGRGRVQMGPSKDQLTFDKEVSDGWCVLVPAGTWHNITNTGDEPMQVYAIYAPVHHKAGKIHPTAQDDHADKDDDPPKWSVQPKGAKPDQHA